MGTTGRVTSPEDRSSALDATGERLVPERQHGELVHAEHLARYRVACLLASSRRVLDAACGAGYGTALLAGAASRAVGVDLDEATISYARSRFEGCEFVVGDVAALPFEAGTFDLVVSFETIEHVSHPERAIEELTRVLADDGVLMMSTPNKHRYLVENEFHRREFFHEEFVDLLSAHFPRVELMLQDNWLTSAVLPVPLAADASGELDHDLVFTKLAGMSPGHELYTIALCGRDALPRVRGAAVAAGLHEAHDLAQRTVEAERTAEEWHAEHMRTLDSYKEAERALNDVYGSVWWRATAPPRRLLQTIRRQRGG
jgi:SAM-dependent methyltransferase